MVVRSVSELMAAIGGITEVALEQAKTPTLDVVKKNVDEHVYGAGTPVEYGRTGNLRDSLDVERTGMILEIAHRDTAFYPSALGGGSGLSTKGLAQVVHNTGAPDVFGGSSTTFWQKPRPYMDRARDELAAYKFKELLADGIRAQGFKVR